MQRYIDKGEYKETSTSRERQKSGKPMHRHTESQVPREIKNLQ